MGKLLLHIEPLIFDAYIFSMDIPFIWVNAILLDGFYVKSPPN